jgi:hypothetical protein
MTLEKIVGTGNQGDFVHQTQGTAVDQGFRNVSKYWYPQTLSYDEMREKLEKHYERRRDLKSPLKGMKPSVNDKGEFVLVAQGGPTDGAAYTLTDLAMRQFLGRIDVQTTFRMLLDDIKYPNAKEDAEPKIKRDKGDVETFVKVVENGLRHYHQRAGYDDQFLFRTYDDNKEIQAVLTDSYSPVDNRWLLKIINELIPGGRYSHFTRATDATIYGNVLIPDSIREEDDSDYGGMVSLNNCEIGTRKLSQSPSVFRAICMNGCIWDQTFGTSFNKRHRGLDLDEVKKSIVENVTKQIPLMHDGIDRLLNTRADAYAAKNVKMNQIFVALGDRLKLQPKHVIQTINQYRKHESQHKNLFGVINAITRAGQEFDNEDWYALDVAGGALTGMKVDQWDKLVDKARSYTDEDIAAVLSKDEKYLATLAV